jgi:hypothetical protein
VELSTIEKSGEIREVVTSQRESSSFGISILRLYLGDECILYWKSPMILIGETPAKQEEKKIF